MALQPESLADVCVIGLGYIGLPTAAFFASTGLHVHGVDLNEELVQKVNSGIVPFVEPDFEDFLGRVVQSGALKASTNVMPAKNYIIAVPTPFNEDKSVDDSFVMSATDSIIPHLRGGELVILESTSPPGLTDRIEKRVLEARKDLTSTVSLDSSVYFAHAPERVLPGRIMEEMVSNDRIIGGTAAKASQLAKKLYERFCEGEVLVTDARTAEMAKLTENAFRDVNIAFANELSMICDDLDVNVWELIRLANHHPRVNILQPGPGVGGHCIAVDPWFLVSASPSNSVLIRASREVNEKKPRFVIQKVENEIAQLTRKSEQTVVSFLGLSFKANIDDLRESPAVEIVKEIALKNPNVRFYVVEPHITSLPEVLEEIENVELVNLEVALKAPKITVLLVDHVVFVDALDRLAKLQRFIDTRGMLQR